MTLEEFKSKLQAINEQGYILSMREGNTGIGFTLETLLGLKENNVKLPDLGEIELKSKRKNATSMVTLFTFNSGVWRVSQADVIRKHGYEDMQSREALKCTVTMKPNAQGLFLKVTENFLHLLSNENEIIASWQSDKLLTYFLQKIPALVLVLADTRLNASGLEEFHYSEAYLLKGPSKIGLMKLIENGNVLVDLRMHLNDSGSVRNRGTAFRALEIRLLECFDKKIRLL